MKYEIVFMAGVAAALSPPLSSTSPAPTIITSYIPLPSSEVTPSSQTGCPTVTSTRELCASCPVPACLMLTTVTQSCSCPTPIPTVYLDFPCKDKCKNIWCSTSYAIVTQTTCATATSSSKPPASSTSTSASSTSKTKSSKPPSTVTSTKTETTTTCTDEDEPEETETTTICTTDEPEETHTLTLPTLPPSSTVTPAPNGTYHSTSRLPGSTSLSSSVVQGGVGRMRPFWGLNLLF